MRTANDELKAVQNKLTQVQAEFDNAQKHAAIKQSHMSELDGQYSSNADRLAKAEGEVLMLQKQKDQLEENLRVHSNDMQKFQYEYEE